MSVENDAASVDAVIRALYETISHDPGGRPDWERMRPLFVAGARLIPPAAQDGVPIQLTVDEFTERVESALKDRGGSKGFQEVEISRCEESYGRVVHAWSTYESRRTSTDASPFARGINSIQVVRTSGGWRIVTVLWDAETQDAPIPERYLKRNE